MVFISVIILHILQITIFHMLDLCGQLFILSTIAATGIGTQDLPDLDQNITNDALDRLAMKAG